MPHSIAMHEDISIHFRGDRLERTVKYGLSCLFESAFVEQNLDGKGPGIHPYRR
jgi:hypothetical protein